ncbi:NADH:ubiquinone oxidoreductase subunit L [Asticcacaulis benevestitus DSM 16100 = ATCC BAA-896]|uniref:NADH-ubiquinone oxidoreductase chain 5 n=2 Tax=Asticcacaulis TaxID=76890 RepID=V4Q8T6_9CAUL|nr:NADH:ubiquinone oxidoreductase subunit L [Asticcacaulis benevestitus DSM 16100 = ATCC BAA-896]
MLTAHAAAEISHSLAPAAHDAVVGPLSGGMATIVTLCVFAPIVGAMIVGAFGRFLGNIVSQTITTGLLFLACALGWYTFIQHTWGGMADFTVNVLPFINIDTFHSAWSIRVDALSATMLIVVTSVSSLVHLYSWGYMSEDPSRPRFFAYLSLFTFAMLMLVTAADFMQLFFGWEGVGLASYLLIGFWYHKDSASSAAIKAFVVNRIGDFGFALGIMTVYWQFGTINFHEFFPLIASHQGQTWEFLGQTFSALDLAAFLLFIGAMGKSAQFFLHTWLPDAMEGPTPVSALIHAATMVTAGVYMVCLLSPLFEYAPVAKMIVAYIGAITAIFAASIGFTQNDIKRVIAYSTCSQLGYMFFAAGVGAYQAAMFHLFTHAFFKALLFLGAGSVIHGMHHEQDMRKMGGLWKYLPITYGVMTIGTIAITGLGIPFTEIGFAGFFSKDAIIESAWAGHNTPQGMFAFIMGISAALLTSFYSWRLIAMTFHGKKQWEHGHGHDDHHAEVIDGHSTGEPDAHAHDDHAHDDHGHGHDHDHKPHESPWVMLVPIILLSFGAIFAGFIFAPYFIGEHAHAFWGHAIFTAPSNEIMHEAHHIKEVWVKLLPLTVTLIGMVMAWYFYILKPNLPKKMAANNGPVYTFLYNKWFFDEIYQATFVRLTRFLGDVFWKVLDIKIIDNLGPNGAAWAALKSAKNLVKTQTGYVYHYAFAMFLGVVGLLTYVFWLVH